MSRFPHCLHSMPDRLLKAAIGIALSWLILTGGNVAEGQNVSSDAESMVPIEGYRSNNSGHRYTHSKTDPNHQDQSHKSHSLGLSDEVIPFESFGKGLSPRPLTLTEVIDDHVYPENIERREMLAARPLDDVDTVVPKRKSLFGSDRFLSSGPIGKGIQLSTGATWRPSFLLFGNFRSALQSYEAAGGERTNEWANRLDIFGNLSLSSTERFLFGFRPLDDEGVFTGVAGGQGVAKSGFTNGLNFKPTTFFFEGDFGEIFPNLDPYDRRHLDYGFSIGRQPLILQDGILSNDNMDAFGITRHNMFRMNASATRMSAFFGFNELHRNNHIRDSRGRLIALSGVFDYPKHTIEADAAYLSGSESLGGDGAYFGIGHLAQFGYWHSTFRVNASFSLNSQRNDAIADGWLLSSQLSRTMSYSDDVLTLSAFGEIDNYTSAARDPATGGPLGGISVLQRAVGIGTYGPAIDAKSGNQLGFEIAYQHFLDDQERRQLLVAAGASGSYAPDPEDAISFALSLQYQQSLSDNLIWTLAGFGTITDDSDKGIGLRTELNRKF